MSPDFFPYWHASKNPGPKSIIEVSEYDGSEDLAIICTQLSYTHTATQQKRIVGDWCKFFSRQQGIKRLWLHSRLPQALFDKICLQENLQSLYIKWSGVKDIGSIPGLKSIKHLYFGASSGIEDIRPMAALKTLQDLTIEGFFKVSDYSPLEQLPLLENLSIFGDGLASMKKAPINSLAPLSKIVNLKTLCLSFVKVLDHSYGVLSSLKNLAHLDLPQRELDNEIKTLLRTLPCLKTGNIVEKNNAQSFVPAMCQKGA